MMNRVLMWLLKNIIRLLRSNGEIDGELRSIAAQLMEKSNFPLRFTLDTWMHILCEIPTNVIIERNLGCRYSDIHIETRVYDSADTQLLK